MDRSERHYFITSRRYRAALRYMRRFGDRASISVEPAIGARNATSCFWLLVIPKVGVTQTR